MLNLKASMNCNKCGRRLEGYRHGARKFCSVRCQEHGFQRYDYPPLPCACGNCGTLFIPKCPKGPKLIGYCGGKCQRHAFYKRLKSRIQSDEPSRLKVQIRNRKYYLTNSSEISAKASVRLRLKRSTTEGLLKVRAKYIIDSRNLRSTQEGRVIHNLRSRLWRAIRRDGSGRKLEKLINLIGCSRLELINHLESGFQPGMTWENYGSEWHIDHKQPCSAFDMLDIDQQKACFHYSNLQPLWAIDNLRKHTHVPHRKKIGLPFAASVTNPSEPEDGEGSEG